VAGEGAGSKDEVSEKEGELSEKSSGVGEEGVSNTKLEWR